MSRLRPCVILQSVSGGSSAHNRTRCEHGTQEAEDSAVRPRPNHTTWCEFQASLGYRPSLSKQNVNEREKNGKKQGVCGGEGGQLDRGGAWGVGTRYTSWDWTGRLKLAK